jgi:hypothetical protein
MRLLTERFITHITGIWMLATMYKLACLQVRLFRELFLHTPQAFGGGQNVHVDVPLCHTGDLVPSYTQGKHTDGRQHIRVDVHSEGSVRKINNIFVCI